MTTLLDGVFIALILLNFFILGKASLRGVIRVVCVQGTVLGLLPLLLGPHLDLRLVLVALGTVALKGVILPRMLVRALEELSIRREVEPYISFPASLVLGALGTGFAMFVSYRLPVTPGPGGDLLTSASISTVLTGFLVLTTRRKALTQVLGYLVLENGIFIFGLLLLEPLPFLVEVAVLLDLFVAIFTMGIVIHHINREFSTESTDRLTALKD
ncbi:MAG: hydrogenase [Candidatus Tectomicrobia bacterium]|uniref:Hydrogenase n=1 Tax=Tectimicrobiota bacterium TaxID=2528274 RepID=A0A932HXQ5_UNCTE|nr:hydrogenase [Candidatus Tectomicrobia bacterium]